MLLKILLALLVLAALFAIIVSLQPAAFRITRSVTIAAPPAAVFAHINDLHEYARWNPWRALDPAMKTTFAGPPSGVGAAMEWSGNNQIGSGRMTITESRPAERVGARLDFIRPFPSVCSAEFDLRAADGGTVVTWSMSGQRTFVPKAIGLFMNMDKMIGTQFERGLAELQILSTAAPARG